jgi:molybdate transport system substrate-binding protein
MRGALRAATVVALAAGLMLTTGCGSSAQPSGQTSASTQSQTQSVTQPVILTVFAAASLKSTFTSIGDAFEAAHPGTTVTFSFAGSSDLVTQIQGGAPVDVFASADIKNMDKLTKDDLVDGTPVDFASNTLEIAVPPDNPAKVASLQDLAKPDVKVVVCAPQVPCGAATQKVETASGVDIKPVSEESSVTDVLNKVTSGEADAGMVYVTDVKGAGDKVKGVTFPESNEAVNTYPIATLAASKNSERAKQFVEMVSGADGQQILAAAGFAKP